MIFRLTTTPARLCGVLRDGVITGSVATYPSLQCHACARPIDMRSAITYGLHDRCAAGLPWPALVRPVFSNASAEKVRAQIAATPIAYPVNETDILATTDDIAMPGAQHSVLALADSKRVAVFAPDGYRDSLRFLPGVSYDKDLRAWVYPFCDEVVERLEAALAYDPAVWRSPAYEAARRRLHADKIRRRYAALPDLPIAGMKTELWGHQRQAYAHIHARTKGLAQGSAMLAMAMGVGKSATAIAALNNAPDANRILILCPRSVMGVWPKQFDTHSARPYHIVVLRKPDGSALSVAAKRERAEAAVAEAAARGLPLVLICNFDSAWRPPLGGWLIKQEWDVIISDESHRHKAGTSKIAKYMADLRHAGRLRLALTGTPYGDKPLDLFGQFRYLDPAIFGHGYVAFRDRFAIMDPYITGKVARYKNLDQLHDAFYTVAYHADESVVPLPERTHTTITIPFEKDARRHYDTAKREFFLELGDRTLNAANAAVLTLRLHQIANGRVPMKDENGEERMVTISTAKVAALTDMLEDFDEPLVVFARFHTDLDQIAEAAHAAGRRYGEVSGRRNELSADATYPEGVDVLGVQIQSGGVGVDLSKAAVGIYFGVDFSLPVYQQSVKRLHRPGSTRPVRIFHLAIERSVDEQIYRALESKSDLIASLLNEPAILKES